MTDPSDLFADLGPDRAILDSAAQVGLAPSFEEAAAHRTDLLPDIRLVLIHHSDPRWTLDNSMTHAPPPSLDLCLLL
jgi:hypothetical protein